MSFFLQVWPVQGTRHLPASALQCRSCSLLAFFSVMLHLLIRKLQHSMRSKVATSLIGCVHVCCSICHVVQINRATLLCTSCSHPCCPRLQIIAPYFEEMAQQIPQIKFAKLNCTSDNAAKKIAMSHSVKALPTFHMFKHGEKVASFVGGKPQQLRRFIEEYLAAH